MSYSFQKLKLFSGQLNSKNIGPVLLYKTTCYIGIETVSSRLLLRMAKLKMD